MDGAAAATVIGAVTFGLGGWPTIIALLFFFLSSSVISLRSNSKRVQDSRRSGKQVWANGFWVVCWLMAGILTNSTICWLAANAAIAAATADTWATELGSRRFKMATYKAFSLKKVTPGTDGGISLMGLIASLAASFCIGSIVWRGFSTGITWFTFIIFAGVAGSLFDSYLGATLQGTKKTFAVPRFRWQQEIHVNNNLVNWMATGMGSLLILILNLLFL